MEYIPVCYSFSVCYVPSLYRLESNGKLLNVYIAQQITDNREKVHLNIVLLLMNTWCVDCAVCNWKNTELADVADFN